ncbi:acyl-CoA thioesterase [Salidesulfovibrio onnuriiensis]|uniref:acyl-CoA thioesterase n=1 Tax=Salidesulfovibrio onnuriiensis TaxID=2583823 RepID=UPI0011C8BAFC|nr:acyl-CoA thioesterase [Salidesulfovibrio onnuriiensis]
MSRKPYFPAVPNSPKPLSVTMQREVRFEEVDPMDIVWHGRYPSYFEDGRQALGKRYDISYRDFRDNEVAAPIKQMHIDYVRPLRFGESMSIETLLHWTEAARLNYEFIIRNGKGEITTTGYTVQLFVTFDQEFMMFPPDFYARFLESWKSGVLE